MNLMNYHFEVEDGHYLKIKRSYKKKNPIILLTIRFLIYGIYLIIKVLLNLKTGKN